MAAAHSRLGTITFTRLRLLLRDKDKFACWGGPLDLKAFKALCSGLAADAKAESGALIADATFVGELFKKFDANGDGAVDFDELKLLFGALCDAPLDVKCQFMFDVLDTDGSYYLERDEVKRWVKVAYNVTGAVLELITSKMEDLRVASMEVVGTAALGQLEIKPGSLSAAAASSSKRVKRTEDSAGEGGGGGGGGGPAGTTASDTSSCSRRVHHSEVADEIFKRMDSNGDGKVSFAEFLAFILVEGTAADDAASSSSSSSSSSASAAAKEEKRSESEQHPFQDLLRFTKCFIDRRALVVDSRAAGRMIAHALRQKGQQQKALATPAHKKVARCSTCTRPTGSPNCHCKNP
eukprot:g3325.t1